MFTSFLNRMGRGLGRAAAIKTITSTHVTFLATSTGMRNVFRTHGFTPQDVRRFSGDLQQYIDDEMPEQTRRVPVYRQRPLTWVGGRSCKLALHLESTDELLGQRELIEQFLAMHFDKVPPLQNFDPHITLGRVDSRLARGDAYRTPELLVPAYAEIPEDIALNGLMTYLDHISDIEEHVTPATG